ncbi:MAG: sulfurtransferase [Desulfuromonas sp.]|nr:MAG: sulfurtransferase [Desulfuromonas sp.]
MTKGRVLKGLLIFGLLVAFSGPAAALDWGSKELETEKIAIKLTREVVSGGYGVVRTDELKDWMDMGKKILIVDTMPLEASYVTKHIPGAVQFEFPIKEVTELDASTHAAYRELLGADQDLLVVVYCGFTKCGRSHNGALWAKKLGYTNVFRYPGGIKAWAQADYPVAKGKN